MAAQAAGHDSGKVSGCLIALNLTRKQQLNSSAPSQPNAQHGNSHADERKTRRSVTPNIPGHQGGNKSHDVSHGL
jgi:hypothetical protein